MVKQIIILLLLLPALLFSQGKPIVNGLVVLPDSGAPQTPVKGEIYMSNVDNKMYFYNGSTWVDMSGGGVGGTADGVITNVFIDTNEMVFVGSNGGFNGALSLAPYLDNTDDQTASEVAITDAGTYYTGANVELALQEVGASLTNKLESVGIADLNAEDFGDFTVTAGVASLDADVVGSTELDASVNASLDLADSATQPGDLANTLTTVGERLLGKVTAGTGNVDLITNVGVRSFLNVEDNAAADQVASEVPFTPTGGIVATNVQAAIAEVAASGATDDQTALEVSYDNTTSGLTAANVQDGIDEVAIEELTQAQFDALSTSEKISLGPYVIIPENAPSGYSVEIINDPVLANGADSFAFASAEVGAYYDYEFQDTGASTVTGFGIIETTTDTITGIDLSLLLDGQITLSATLTNARDVGLEATDIAQKGSGTDLWFENDVTSVSAETTSVSIWDDALSNIVASRVANTDGSGGGSDALRISAPTDGWKYVRVNLSSLGLQLVPHTMTLRVRSDSPEHGVFLWTNVDAFTSDVAETPVDSPTVSNGTWYTRTITFTPTSTAVEMRIYLAQIGGTDESGKFLEVSEITLEQN